MLKKSKTIFLNGYLKSKVIVRLPQISEVKRFNPLLPLTINIFSQQIKIMAENYKHFQ